MPRAKIVAALVVGSLSLVSAARAATPSPEPQAFLRELSFPTNLAFAPDGRLFFTEKETGRVRVVVNAVLDPTPVASFDVAGGLERGLLGIALDPRFTVHPWIYVYRSDPSSGRNLISRFLEDRPAETQTVLLQGLAHAVGLHNGGDLVFGSDGMLYATIGDGEDAPRAQDRSDLGGKVVRLDPTGAPADGPFGAGNPVWSYGHRNSFGLCVDPANGDLWETENGPERDDELNLITRGGNYGWPEVTGTSGRADLVDPVAVFPDTVALTGCAVVDGAVYAGAYNDATLYVLPAGAARGGSMQAFVSFDAGITDVAAGPDGLLYVATTDGIWTVAPAGSAVSSRGSSPSAVASAPTDGGGSVPWAAALAAVGVAVGLAIRFAAGRRLR